MDLFAIRSDRTTDGVKHHRKLHWLLGRQEIGRLEPGAAADLAVFRLDRVDFAGAMHDPAAAILYCGSGIRADYTIVAGRVLVEGGRLVGIDEERLFHRANEIAARLVGMADA